MVFLDLDILLFTPSLPYATIFENGLWIWYVALTRRHEKFFSITE